MHLLVVLIGAGYMARTKRFTAAVATERTIPAAPRVRRRSFGVMGGIVSGIIANSILAVLCFIYAARPASMTTMLSRLDAVFQPSAGWLWPLLGALFLANVLLLVVIYGWQRWGVIGLVLVTIAQAVAIGNSGLPSLYAWIFFILAGAPVALLILLLCSGPRPTMWEQME